MASPKILILVVAVCVLVVSACGPTGDLEKGIAAYESEDWDTAYLELNPLAERDVPEAQHYVGLLYLKGEAVPKSEAMALEYLRAAADQGYAESQYELGLRIIKGDGLEQDIPEGELMLRAAFENGNIKGARALCIAFQGYQWGVPKDTEKSFKWCRLAVEQGGALEKAMLGHFLSLGSSLEEIKEGYEWLSVAADEGNQKAHEHMGDAAFRLAKKHEEKSPFSKEAQEWYEIASKHGNLDGQAEMGWRYALGYSHQYVEKDVVKGLRLLRTAAENGSNRARYVLCELASVEISLINNKECVEWATLALEEGYPWAYHHLAVLYYNGDGVPKDYVRSAELERAGADLGDPHSQFNMGVKHFNGEGVPRDLVLSYKWFNLVAAASLLDDLRTDAIQNRDDVARMLTPYQLAEAQRLSREWKKNEKVDSLDAGEEKVIKSVKYGTGFVINQDGAVLTNHHVVEGCNSIYANGTLVEILADDSFNDLSVLSGIREASIAEFRSNGFVDVGDEVIAVGFPFPDLLASSLQAVSGVMSAEAGPDNDSRYIQITAPINAGNSGGPLMDASGNVLGVVSMTLDSLAIAEESGTVPQNVNFAIKSSVVMSFLESNDIEYEKARSWWAKDASDVVKRAREFTVLVECRE